MPYRLTAVRCRGSPTSRENHAQAKNESERLGHHISSAVPALRHGKHSHSAAQTARNSAIPITVSTAIAANSTAISICACSWIISHPNPADELTHSPKTAPTTLKVTAILAPEKKYGSAAGSSTNRSIDQRPAPSVRMTLVKSRSTLWNPSTVLTTTGKKQTRHTTTNRGRTVNPNRTSSTGASAITGTVWEAITSG